jgi:hypothetical protein
MDKVDPTGFDDDEKKFVKKSDTFEVTGSHIAHHTDVIVGHLDSSGTLHIELTPAKSGSNGAFPTKPATQGVSAAKGGGESFGSRLAGIYSDGLKGIGNDIVGGAIRLLNAGAKAGASGEGFDPSDVGNAPIWQPFTPKDPAVAANFVEAFRPATMAAVPEVGGGVVADARTLAKAEVFAARTAPELKKIYGWGNGLEGVTAARGALNASAMERIQGSVSRAEVEATRNLYKEAAAAGRGGNVAPQRAAYMEDILKLWK